MAKEQNGKFKELLALLGTISGDLSNVTSPPQFLAPISFTELPSGWAQRPSLFIAPAFETDPLQRALRVLEWELHSLKFQYYVGPDSSISLKKPLNAFLGEIFRGQWTDDSGTTKVFAEQVSHHPPITASTLTCEELGLKFRGYSRPEMTFAGSFNVKHTGLAILHLDKYDEDYLIPLPTCRVKGFLARKLYPELIGTHYIVSSAGYISEITFGGEGFFSGVRNSFQAKLYRQSDRSKTPLYTASGTWNEGFTVRNMSNKTDVVKHHIDSTPASPMQILDVDEQDPWETHRAWRYVLDALRKGDMLATIREKSKLEEAQRAMRRKEAKEGIKWEPKFYYSSDDDETFHRLADSIGLSLQQDKTKGVWRIDDAKVKKARRPYHGSLTPYGTS